MSMCKELQTDGCDCLFMFMQGIAESVYKLCPAL